MQLFAKDGLTCTLQHSYAIVNLGRAPVNSMNSNFWNDMTEILNLCETNKSVRGLIIQSTLPRPVFTAGNDIAELYAPMTSKEKYRNFWVGSNTFLCRLLRSPLVTMTLIRGACPAGGTCLALCTDYRIMSQKSSYMGLNEVALGIAVPRYWGDLMGRIIGPGKASIPLMMAQFFDGPKAKEVGLIHELVQEDQLLSRGEQVMQEFLKLPDYGRIRTKLQLVEAFSKEWESRLDEEAAGAWEMLSMPSTVEALKGVMARLSKPKS